MTEIKEDTAPPAEGLAADSKRPSGRPSLGELFLATVGDGPDLRTGSDDTAAKMAPQGRIGALSLLHLKGASAKIGFLLRRFLPWEVRLLTC